ncbi:uncharacterized protein LOC106671955 [Cimex lectularius]|uniref:Spaetzle domain-containing protein n=1 Tax=Cimex lectularius TaxID=79782 RepID=A0A8I6TJZ6_CIMLE|nr:uncharacterized protein LOC106671955 [Cimex lectularius]
MKFILVIACAIVVSKKCIASSLLKDPLRNKGGKVDATSEENNEGYYQFLEAGSANPPKVKHPPYYKSPLRCPGADKPYAPGKSLTNLCGDLNKGFIPENPMNQTIEGMPYPFELITNKTLQFLSRTLPILQNDETIPKVINYNANEKHFYYSKTPQSTHTTRVKREDKTGLEGTFKIIGDFFSDPSDILNKTRKFCENGQGMVCVLYRAIQGESAGLEMKERKEDISLDEMPLDGPPTPCPAKIEYATPVFARNYKGIWRYVVQIPYEGYFTQTVEVTKCLNTRCHYMEGKCLSSPRWVSLLVAEIFYPNGLSGPVKEESQNNGVQDSQAYSYYKTKDTIEEEEQTQCDGIDKNGCYQVRLYYDWFLIPGSCKCWRTEYIYRYINLS